VPRGQGGQRDSLGCANPLFVLLHELARRRVRSSAEMVICRTRSPRSIGTRLTRCHRRAGRFEPAVEHGNRSRCVDRSARFRKPSSATNAYDCLRLPLALDASINEIRTPIFDLGEGSCGGLSRTVLALADGMARILGARPEVVFAGPLGITVPQLLADHLLAEMRAPDLRIETCPRVARRHCHRGRFCRLGNHDNESGFDLLSVSGGLGLTILSSRAEKLEGAFDVASVLGGGARLVWSAPH
jgi:hypothetical protein